MCETRFPNIFLDIHIWVLILRNTKDSGTSYKNLWEKFKAHCYGKCGNCMSKFSTVAFFKSEIKKISCIAQIYISSPISSNSFFHRVLLLLVNIVVKRSFIVIVWKYLKGKKKYSELPNRECTFICKGISDAKFCSHILSLNHTIYHCLNFVRTNYFQKVLETFCPCDINRT